MYKTSWSAHNRLETWLSLIQEVIDNDCFMITDVVEDYFFHNLSPPSVIKQSPWSPLYFWEFPNLISTGNKDLHQIPQHYVNITTALDKWWISLNHLQSIQNLFSSMHSALCHVIVQFASSVLRHGYLINVSHNTDPPWRFYGDVNSHILWPHSMSIPDVHITENESVMLIFLYNWHSIHHIITTDGFKCCQCGSLLTHWGVDNLTIIGPDNGLSPGRCQAII